MTVHRIDSIKAYKQAVRLNSLYVQVAAPTASAVRITHDEGRRLVKQWLASRHEVEVDAKGGAAFLSARHPQPYRDEPPKWVRPGVLVETLD